MRLAAPFALLAAILTLPASPAAAEGLRLLDAHTHVMIENITPDEEVALLKKAGIDQVIFMHPDARAVAALGRRYPGFVIPSLGVARAGVNGLHLDGKTGAAMLQAKRSGQVCAFGEVAGQLFGDNPDLEPVYAAAEATGAPLNLHIDLARPGALPALEAALSAHPKAHIVLAHLGWTAGPELIGRLLDAHPNLYTDVSIRFDAPGSLPWRNNGLDLSILNADLTIQPGWRALMERRPDRFLFAMDINSFGPRYTITEDLAATARKALAPLPEPVRNAIAHANAERLLTGCAALHAGHRAPGG